MDYRLTSALTDLVIQLTKLAKEATVRLERMNGN